MILMQSKNLHFEILTTAHADDLFPILTTPLILSFIDPTGDPPTLEELRADYRNRMNGPVVSTSSNERWFNMAICLKDFPFSVIGRLEATGYGEWIC
jgi:hypothetical protein